jgi:hypothetical protein
MVSVVISDFTLRAHLFIVDVRQQKDKHEAQNLA